jgi:hypothetical protein
VVWQCALDTRVPTSEQDYRGDDTSSQPYSRLNDRIGETNIPLISVSTVFWNNKMRLRLRFAASLAKRLDFGSFTFSLRIDSLGVVEESVVGAAILLDMFL